jgi:outer membrane receptor protein involved in Fe transport
MRSGSSLLLAACSLFALNPALAHGADYAAEPAQAVSAGDDIIVTAQKREQKVKDVPLTVSTISQDDLTRLGVSELGEMASYVPGLQIQKQSANNPGFVICGITSDSGSAQAGSRVSVFYNGVDISRARGAWQDLFDMERIEVVKGRRPRCSARRRKWAPSRSRRARSRLLGRHQCILRQLQPHAGVRLPQCGQ